MTHAHPHGGGMRTSIATVCLSGTLEDKLEAAAAAGFDGVEIFENDLIASPASPEEVGRLCADLGLSIELYQPFRDFEGVDEDRLHAGLRRAERKFDVMERLGTSTMLVCSTVSPHAVDDDELAAAQLRTLAEHASRRGIRIAYEALAWGRYVDTWARSWDIVRRGDHPALGLCLDSFHVLSREPSPSGIAGIPGEKLFFLQLADAPQLSMDVLQWSRHHRLFPRQGAFDLPTFLRDVLDTGYSGPLSLEVFNDVFRQSDPNRTAVDAMRSLRTLDEAVDHRGRAVATERAAVPATTGATTGTATGAAAGSLPGAAELTGHAFTELGVDARSAARVERALATMGFAHRGQHRSKPVQLWQQGTARVLLNTVDAGDEPGGVAEIRALAVDSLDPASSARRAEALLAPVLPRTRGPAEADLSSVAAPDGTAVFFCRTGAEDDVGWLSDFILTGTETAGGTGLARTDHVALTQPFDWFDEAGLFYRSVLGLEPHHDAEYAAPFGLMRSRAVTDVDGDVRIALNSTLLRRGEWAPGVPDPQHIAFASDDIFASAQAMRERGGEILPVPDNYYDDLEARLELDADLIARMRACDVLYDQDEHGAFFHLYTEMLGSRVFFEIVQRVGGYAGYGSVNAPVRMAAHRRSRLARR
ncbi:4-hydroxyphenylpyruvate dioxygenase [Haloechinothrix alba]|uniref:3-dehydroshikimate dehydratase n=1 Tax=Haloechinothrix alba TaxID=664784 RepID=A0A238VQG6_9PSEU|nr:sugar phosphate isomerase/epimerase and 4-hydroxyphenylpyruvate domain-containing protein [Haloechinothrix alba]SNR36387.1 4-hydroxyphenylpyruvate dioxygenase [Haloechinothrix alba]